MGVIRGGRLRFLLLRAPGGALGIAAIAGARTIGARGTVARRAVDVCACRPRAVADRPRGARANLPIRALDRDGTDAGAWRAPGDVSRRAALRGVARVGDV